jgi:hypothetical protein
MSRPLLVAVDPGIRGVGLAVFDDASGELQFARYVKSPRPKGNRADEARAAVLAVRDALAVRAILPRDVRRVAVEWPQNYTAGQQKGDQNDLLPLSAVSTGVSVLFPEAEVTSYVPREWKDTMRDFICAARTVARLTEVERQRFEDLAELERLIALCRSLGVDLKTKSSKAHNTCDATGIGLKLLGRFERERVIAR